MWPHDGHLPKRPQDLVCSTQQIAVLKYPGGQQYTCRPFYFVRATIQAAPLHLLSQLGILPTGKQEAQSLNSSKDLEGLFD
jgi:hypothetical protein